MAEHQPSGRDGPSRRGVHVRSSLGEKVDAAWTALLVIDMLNDLVDPEGKTATQAGRPIDNARAVIPAQQRLLAAARRAGVMVVHLAQVTAADGSSLSGPWLDARSRATYSVSDLCIEGSWGAEIVTELAPDAGEAVVRKFSYSGFAGTPLDAILRSHRVETVTCIGVSTNACVEATAREAFSHGYYVVLVEDACASWRPDLHRATLETAAHRYASVCASQRLVDLWSPAGTGAPGTEPGR